MALLALQVFCWDVIVLDIVHKCCGAWHNHDGPKAGEPTAPGWAIDEQGEPTQDTAAAQSSAVLPMAVKWESLSGRCDRSLARAE